MPSKYVPEHLQSAVGNITEAKLMYIPCHLENTVDDKVHPNLLLSYAITDELKPAIGLLSLND